MVLCHIFMWKLQLNYKKVIILTITLSSALFGAICVQSETEGFFSCITSFRPTYLIKLRNVVVYLIFCLEGHDAKNEHRAKRNEFPRRNVLPAN